MSAITTLAHRPELRSETLKLIKEHFPRGAKLSRDTPVHHEFALLLDEKNQARNFIVISEGRIAATASYRVFNFKNIRVAGVGLVITHPHFQKRGFSRALQEQIEREAFIEGCALTVLWSDLSDFYTKLGYLVAGFEAQWHIQAAPATPKHYGVRALRKNEYQILSDLYQTQSFGPARNWLDYEKILSLPETTTLGAFNKQNELVAYGIMGKARDLRGCVHELMGEAQAAVDLLSSFFSLHPSSSTEGLRLQLPWHSSWHQELTTHFGDAEKTAMAFMKCLNKAGLIKYLEQEKLLPRGVEIKAKVHGFEILKNGTLIFESDDSGHLLQLFMGPWLPIELEGLDSELQVELSEVKISPLYFWGLDSV